LGAFGVWPAGGGGVTVADTNGRFAGMPPPGMIVLTWNTTLPDAVTGTS
jgi:hypothetical protein